MERLIRRGLAWAPVTKAAALFLLPLPLLVASVVALVRGDVGQLALAGGSLGCLWGAGALCWRALVADARHFLGERPDPPTIPLKLIASLLTAIGAALAAVAAGYEAPAVLVFGALGGLGARLFYGADIRPRPIRIAVVEGVDRDALTLQLKQAYGRLRGIEASARAIAVPEFGDRLARITEIGHGVLQRIEQHPREAARARRFLNLYLDSAERVTAEYARTHRQLRSRPLEDNFRQLLIDMEQTFADQQRKLHDQETLSLEAEIEVLNTRLRREGAG